MGERDDYLTTYRVFFENFAATVDPEDQLPVNIAGYTITEAELPGEVIYWTTQYLTEKQCPLTLMAPLQRIILDEVRVASKKHPNEFGYNSDESEYVALRLMQAVTARVNDVCIRYLDNARLDTLPPPPPPTMKELRTVSSATKNIRRVMEDRHVEIGNLEALFGIETTEPTSFYAVYDGHAGSAAATYCAAHLHQYLAESPHFARDLRRATTEAYLRTDADFVRKSNQKGAAGGSTAVSVCVRARRLLAAWAGDSQALLAKRMRLMQLVHPHKPDRADERERIESSGGSVMYYGTWRVNGQLAVSRAIGDANYKPYVTARPEIVEVDLDGDEDFVILACDGLWDFVSEDVVALSVYNQLMNDPDDLKAVPKNLIRIAKKECSDDNISIIVVFLKDPRDIVADNRLPMDLGLDNAVVNAPPFAVVNEACKMVVAEGGRDCAEGGDNGVSDSDSDDLGPETAVDVDLDIDDDAEMDHNEPAAPTPPAHTVEDSHVDGNLVDNVAESGEESEDEWNYYKGEGEQEQNLSEEVEEPPRSETPCQDNSAWESSSVDMNSSPLNPDAPVFVPGGVAGSDVLLAESPRKPLPMDDIELPDVAQFENEAVIRPAELQDLDNCDHLNGHHNISMEGVTQHLNGNEKCEMESLGFGFNVGIEQEKIKDTSLFQDFERIQKDTTDFCNIQVFPAHTETNPFTVDDNDELFERLKNKENDPMSMSFYQEKDDDTCERFGKIGSHVDLNAVQPLPDSDDEDNQQNGVCENVNENKENICPEERTNLFNLERDIQEPNNDIIRFNDRSEIVENNVSSTDNFMDFNIQNTNMQNYSSTEFECNIQQEPVAQTDTPESHKLLVEQIPEIPDGKNSELGFSNEDLLDPSDSDKEGRAITPQDEVSQDIEMESKFDESPSEEIQPEIVTELIDDQADEDNSKKNHQVEKAELEENEIVTETAISPEVKEELNIEHEFSSQHSDEDIIKPSSPEMAQENVVVEVHETPVSELNDLNEDNVTDEIQNDIGNEKDDLDFCEFSYKGHELKFEKDEDNELQTLKTEFPSESPSQSPAPSEPIINYSPVPVHESPLFKDSPLPVHESPLPKDSPLPVHESPLPKESPLPVHDSPLPNESPLPVHESPLPNESQLPVHVSPLPNESQLPVHESPLPTESPLPVHESPMPVHESPLPVHESPLPQESPLLQDPLLHRDSPLPQEISLPRESPLLQDNLLSRDSPIPNESPLPQESLHPRESPLPQESPVPTESPLPEMPSSTQFLLQKESPIPQDTLLPEESPTPRESPLPSESLIVSESLQPISSPVPVELIEPSSSPISMSPHPTELEGVEAIAPTPSPLPTHTVLESQSQLPSHVDFKPPVPAEVPLPVESPTLAESPLPEDKTDKDIVHANEILEEKDTLLTTSPSPIDTTSPIESELVETQIASPQPLDLGTETIETHVESNISVEDEKFKDIEKPSPHHADLHSASPVPVQLLVHTESFAPMETSQSIESPVPVEPVHTEIAPLECELPEESSVEKTSTAESGIASVSPTPVDVITESTRTELSPVPVTDVTDVEIISSGVQQSAPEIIAPAPDIVPEERLRTEIVTDIDIGIPESRAQEICVPVTSEIQQDDAVQPGATPPPTPAVEPAPPAALGEAPIAAATAAVAAAAAAAAVSAVAATTAKTKSAGSPKKSPTTPAPKTATAKTSSKTTPAARTPASATKRSAPPSTTSSPRTPAAAARPAARTPASASKAAPRAAPKPAASPATKPAAKPAAAPAQARAAAPLRSAPAPRPAPKAPATKPAASAAPAKTTATAPKAAPAPISRPIGRPTSTTLTARPLSATAPITKPKDVKPKPAAAPSKPLTNGDVKAAAKAPSRAAVPRAAPRPAPRPAAAAAPKPAAPKPAARAPLDKQSKDLANKRITAKSAPPRTTTTKAPTGLKGVPAKVGVKKPVDKREATNKTLANGADEVLKLPPSPPADNALLPDVIA